MDKGKVKQGKIVWENVLMGAMRNKGIIDWVSLFDERQRQEIAFDVLYADQFSHGTDGHNARLIIARMSDLLDVICQSVTFKDKP